MPQIVRGPREALTVVDRQWVHRCAPLLRRAARVGLSTGYATSYDVSTPKLAALARRDEICRVHKFSDRAPLKFDDNFARLNGSCQTPPASRLPHAQNLCTQGP